MPDPASTATVEVRLNTPRTAARLALAWSMLVLALMGIGVALWLFFGALSFGAHSVGFGEMAFGLLGVALVMTWTAGRYFREMQTLTVEAGSLVIRTHGLVGPRRVHRVALDKIRGCSLTLRKYAGDAAGTAYRPSFSPRVVLVGVHGSTPVAVGVAQSLSEASLAREALNRLIGGDDVYRAGYGPTEDSGSVAVRTKRY